MKRFADGDPAGAPGTKLRTPGFKAGPSSAPGIRPNAWGLPRAEVGPDSARESRPPFKAAQGRQPTPPAGPGRPPAPPGAAPGSASTNGACAKSGAFSSTSPPPVFGSLAKSSGPLASSSAPAPPNSSAASDPSASSSAAAPLPPWKVNKQPDLPKPSLGSKAAPPRPSSAPVQSGPVLIPPPILSPPVKGAPPHYPAKAGQPGFSKAGLPPAVVPPVSNAALDILRQGEELLRQTALLQEREELVKLREEEERMKQEEKRKRQEELERIRQEEERRKQEEMERIRLQMEQAKKEAEERRRQKEEAERKEREHGDLQAHVLQSELVKLVEVAEEHVKMVVEQAEVLESPAQSVEDVVLLGDAYEPVAQTATSSVKACFFFMEGKHVKVKGNAEETMANCASLVKRVHAAKAKCETTTTRVRKRAKEAQEEIVAQTLQVELESLLVVAETEAEGVKELQSKADEALASAKAQAGSNTAGGGEADRDLVRVLTELEKPGAAALDALKRCISLLDKDLVRMRGPTEELKNACAKLNSRTRKLKSNVDEVLAKAKNAKAAASMRIDREDRKQAAKDEADKQDATFKKYDEDGDGLLNRDEILAYVLGEYGFALAEEKLKPMLSASSDGVPLSEFARLRSQVGVVYSEILGKERKARTERQLAAIRKDVVETTGAIAGVEAEIAKAEVQVRSLNPLLPRAAQNLEFLMQKTEEADSAVGAAEDFLAAAKEQAQRLGRNSGGELEKESNALALQEAKRLNLKIGMLERRLVAAASVTKTARGKIELAERKAALLNSL